MILAPVRRLGTVDRAALSARQAAGGRGGGPGRAAQPRWSGSHGERGSGAGRSEGLEGAHAELFERLRALRLAFARSEGVAAYLVFPDRTLLDMAERRPATLSELREVQGVGERKLARYGAAFLEVLRGA